MCAVYNYSIKESVHVESGAKWRTNRCELFLYNDVNRFNKKVQSMMICIPDDIQASLYTYIFSYKRERKKEISNDPSSDCLPQVADWYISIKDRQFRKWVDRQDGYPSPFDLLDYTSTAVPSPSTITKWWTRSVYHFMKKMKRTTTTKKTKKTEKIAVRAHNQSVVRHIEQQKSKSVDWIQGQFP